jgi:N-acylneuraminate cytidylyltransferase
MWVKNGGIILPIMPFSIAGTPWHSNQYASLPEVFVQNASLEISWVKNVTQYKSISGDIIAPFFTEGLEGFDINNVEDWILAENYVNEQVGILPDMHVKPYIIKK